MDDCKNKLACINMLINMKIINITLVFLEAKCPFCKSNEIHMFNIMGTYFFP